MCRSDFNAPHIFPVFFLLECYTDTNSNFHALRILLATRMIKLLIIIVKIQPVLLELW
jgi:hypothetical protein